MGHVGAPGGLRHVGVVLVLDLVQQDRAGALREQVPAGDPVHLGQPLVHVREVGGVVGPGRALGRRQPPGEAAPVDLGVDVRAGPQDDVQPGLGGHAQEQVEVADAAEVVPARGGGVVVPGHVDADGVVPVRPHLLQHVPPQRRARQPERVHLAGPHHQPPPVHEQRVAVVPDGVPPAVGARRQRRRTGRRAAARVRRGRAGAAAAAQGEPSAAEPARALKVRLLSARWILPGGLTRGAVRPLSLPVRPTMDP